MSRQCKTNQGPQVIFKRLPKRGNCSVRKSHPQKYILEGETREIGQVVTSKSVTAGLSKPNCNSSIVTFKFTQVPQETFSNKMMPPSRIDFSRRRNASKQMYGHSYKQNNNNNKNLLSIRVSSCEVRKLDSEICKRRSRKRVDVQDQFCGLQVQGVSTNMHSTYNQTNYGSRASVSANRMRLTVSSFRVKSHQGDITNQTSSIQLVDYLRKPNFKKDHFVFSLADKTDSPDTRIEVFRDFLWKVNYSNAIFTITPNQPNCTYKAFIGKGNNSIMVKAILRHRNWWTVVQEPNEANFVWTQLKINSFFETQPYQKIDFSLKDIYSQNVKKIDTPTKIEDDAYSRLFNVIDLRNWRDHYKRNIKTEQKICSTTYMKRVGLLNKKRLLKIQNPCSLKVQNHLFQNYYIGNKKALFYNLKRYYEYIGKPVFDAIPLTFHLTRGVEDQKYAQFLKVYQSMQLVKKTEREFRNIWIMKPGESTNRGNGISVCFSLDDIHCRLKNKQKNKDGSLRTFILQKYMQKPLLYHDRKFDIRHYMLVTCFSGIFRGYWYEQGYVRTSSFPYSLKNNRDLYVHLTNDAVQKNCDSYGKYEPGNKISYQQLQKYIAKLSKKADIDRVISFNNDILPRMKEIALDSIKATYHLLDKTRKHHNFQLLGLDFMIDAAYRPILIQVNTNPCLELSCPLLQSIIPPLIQNTFKLCVDPLFPPPQGVQAGKKGTFFCDNHIEDNKFHLIFDESLSKEELKALFEGRQRMGVDLGNIDEDSEFQNDGIQNWQQKKQ